MIYIKKGTRKVGKVTKDRFTPLSKELRKYVEERIPPKVVIEVRGDNVLFSERKSSLSDVYHIISYLPRQYQLVVETKRLAALPALEGIWVTLKTGRRVFIKTGWKPAGSALINKALKPSIRAPFADKVTLQRLRSAQKKVVLFLSALPEKHIKKAELDRFYMTVPSELTKVLKAKGVSGNYVGIYDVRKKLIMLTPKSTKELRDLTHLHIGYSLSFKVPRDPEFRDDFLRLFGRESKISREVFASTYSVYAAGGKTRKALKALQPEVYTFFDRLFTEW